MFFLTWACIKTKTKPLPVPFSQACTTSAAWTPLFTRYPSTSGGATSATATTSPAFRTVRAWAAPGAPAGRTGWAWTGPGTGTGSCAAAWWWRRPPRRAASSTTAPSNSWRSCQRCWTMRSTKRTSGRAWSSTEWRWSGRWTSPRESRIARRPSPKSHISRWLTVSFY